MNNVVTPETAQRLKDAGFPQPEPKPGQVWHCGCDFEWPTIVATSDMLVDGVEKTWICADNIAVFSDFFGGVKFTHTNPAEAAALAWLDKHEKENG